MTGDLRTLRLRVEAAAYMLDLTRCNLQALETYQRAGDFDEQDARSLEATRAELPIREARLAQFREELEAAAQL